MPDEFDRIQSWNETYLEADLKNERARVAAALAVPSGFDGQHCTESECGEPIESARLAIGLSRCAECQRHRDRVDAARQRNGRME